MEVLPPSLSCFSHIPPFLATCTVFDRIFGIRQGALEMCYILVPSMYPPGLVENESYKLTFTLTRCIVIDSYIYLVIFEPMPHWTSPCLLLPLLLSFLCQAGYVNGNPSGSRLENRSKKPSWRSGVFIGDDSSDEPRVTDFLVLIHSTGNTDYMRDDHPPTPKPSRQPDSLSWEPTRPQYEAYFLGTY